MLTRKVKPGFATLHVQTQIVAFPTTHIALTAYVSGNVKCLAEHPNVPCMVEIVVQRKTLWVEVECLTASDNPDNPFDFEFTDQDNQVAA